jgi:hypothetical protein
VVVGRDRMVVEFTTTYAISANHHWCCKFESRDNNFFCSKGASWTISRPGIFVNSQVTRWPRWVKNNTNRSTDLYSLTIRIVSWTLKKKTLKKTSARLLSVLTTTSKPSEWYIIECFKHLSDFADAAYKMTVNHGTVTTSCKLGQYDPYLCLKCRECMLFVSIWHFCFVWHQQRKTKNLTICWCSKFIISLLSAILFQRDYRITRRKPPTCHIREN